MPLAFADRLITILATATLTSAAWIVFGSGVMSRQAEPDRSPAARISPTVADESQTSSSTSQNSPRAVETNSGSGGTLLIPVAGVSSSQLADTFTEARAGGQRVHDAIDIMAPAGTPVLAAAAGTVEKLFRSDAGGNTVYVRSADRRTIHYYAHLRDYAPGLKEGQKIERGQTLGSVGSTGNANPAAPHLHFAILQTTPDAEWYDPATAINPFPLLGGT